jgi:ABC-2 type transport system ATP-binding protein
MMPRKTHWNEKKTNNEENTFVSSGKGMPAVTATKYEPAILIESLVKRYDLSHPPAVDGIDLEVSHGEIFGFLGPNGAGKTTTIGICTTRVIATSGRVRVVGVDVASDPALVKQFIGVVTQYSTLDRSLTTLENLIYHVRYFGAGWREAQRKAEALLTHFQLADSACRMPDQLSGGMAQRLQIARAIGHDPQVLFLDEPTAGLDPQSRLGFWDLVKQLRQEGTTILLTTHNMEEANELCDRVAIIDHGHILVCDSPERLIQTAVTKTEIHLELSETPQELLAALCSIPGVDTAVAVPDGIRILASGQDGLLLQRVVEATHDHSLRNLTLKMPTLETVFIELTGRALRE